MKQNKSCLAPGAGGGGGGAAPFSISEALSSAGLGLLSRAVMLPLRALIYRCLELLSESVTSSTAVGWRRVLEKLAGLMARCSSLILNLLC